MSVTVKKFRLFCNTCDAYKEVWNTETPTTCPTNAEHSIDAESITIIDTVSTTEVTPTAPKNEFDLKPYGIAHRHINSFLKISSLVLSDKDGSTYDYLGTDPAIGDCIAQDNNQIRDLVVDVDTENHTVTTSGELSNGSATLSKPIDIDFKLPTDTSADLFYLWGCLVSSKDYGDDDIVRLQIIDKDGVGVTLGWYTQQEFEAMGSLYVVKEYDECWVNQMAVLNRIMTPDGAPGEIPVGLYLRAKYYPKDASKTDVKLWIDYIITVKDA